ncbi:MAG: NADH-quinone oxidoreductase subunit M [Ferroplasma sp.]
MMLLYIFILFFALAISSFFIKKHAREFSAISLILLLLIFIAYSIDIFSGYKGGFIASNDIVIGKYTAPGIIMELNFSTALDGFTDVLVIMSMFIALFAVMIGRTTYSPEFYGWIMLSGMGLMGLFISRNFLFFYIFWEAVLIPLFFLISRYGKENREKSAFKFFIYMHVGSLFLMLSIFTLAMFYFYHYHLFTLQIGLLMQYSFLKTVPGFYLAFAMFGFLLAFFLKLPSFPLHAWLPDAHANAPYSGSVMLSGALLPMGAYGLLGILEPVYRIFPKILAYGIISLGIFSLIYLAFAAMSQTNLKRMAAYASASDMSFITIAFGTSMLSHGYVAIMDISGGMYQIIGHSFIVALVFGSIAYMERKTGTINRHMLGGINREIPYVSFFVVAGMLGSMGMPPLSEFIGEVSIIISSFQSIGLISIFIIVQVILATSYMTYTIQQSIFGIYNERLGKLKDINRKEIGILSVILVASVILGVYPSPFFHILVSYSSSII